MITVSRSHTRRIPRGVALAAVVAGAFLGTNKAHAADDWRRDCVGRVEVTLPARVDVAAYRFTNFRQQLDASRPGMPAAEFRDGGGAPHATHAWYGGSIVVSHPLTTREAETLRRDAAAVRTDSVRISRAMPAAPEGSLDEPAKLSRIDGVTWGLRAYGALFFVGDHAVLWESSGGIRASAPTLRALDLGLSKREPFAVPKAPGVCLASTFVPDDGRTQRDVATTYRLRDHPDVQITVRDASARVPEPGVRPERYEPEAVMVGFWKQELNGAREVRPMWSPSAREVTIAGWRGLASLVQMTRDDGTLDLGYMAVVRGDPSAAEDTPDLMVHVVQDGKAARSGGKRPFDRQAFVELAEKVAAGVKRRERD